MIRLENWSVVTPNVDRYTPPECIHPSLHGCVYGHPKFKDGEEITTSSIVEVNGDRVTVHSGNIYVLGQPEPAYMEFCHKIGKHVPTETTPIKML